MNKIEISPGIEITKDYALYLEEERTAVIADLHLGYEGVLHEQGVSIPRFQKKIMLDHLRNILDSLNPKTILVNGDFKHEFSRNLREEWNEVSEVLDFLEKRAEVLLTRGNHDNFLKTILSKRGLDLPTKLKLGGMTFVHGHEDFTIEGKCVIGHEHPSLKLKDEIGATINLPCFLVSSKIIVLPAFSPLAYGSDVSSYPYLSPVLNKMSLEDAKVYALDDKIGLLDFKRLRDLE